LNINKSKTKIIDLTKNNERKKSITYNLIYLGYKFKMSYSRKTIKKNNTTETFISRDKLQIFMSDDKLKRFKNKMEKSFSDYLTSISKYATEKNPTERMLLKRIKFLTNNHQLFRRKSNVFIGIYFSNEFLSMPYSDLLELDLYLKDKISTLPASTNSKLIDKLDKLSFENGFKTKSIVRFNMDSFKNGKMIQIWKNL
jgi:hypothetical protein